MEKKDKKAISWKNNEENGNSMSLPIGNYFGGKWIKLSN